MESLISTYSQFDLFQKSVFWLIGVFVIFGLIKAVFSDIIEDSLFEMIVELIYTNIPIICFILFFAKMAIESKGNIIVILCFCLGVLLESLLLITFNIRNIRRWAILHTLKKEIENDNTELLTLDK